MRTPPFPCVPTFPVVHPYLLDSCGLGIAGGLTQLGSLSSAVWPEASRAYLFPIKIGEITTLTKAWSVNGTVVSGNLDIGLYDAAGTRLLSTGSTAQAGTSTLQIVDITDVTIPAGHYYLALAEDNAAATFLRGSWPISAQNFAGVLSIDPDVFPLPATVTPTTLGGGNYTPLFGFLVGPRTVL